MFTLTGENLGKRQQELNTKVNETAASNVNFEEIKVKEEQADVDRLFKIDLASKYKNVDYLVEMLKSGDSLYISRVLRCVWLFEDEYSNIINPDYLHHNIFPFMSNKMKKKLLSAISMYVSCENRAAEFYKYCEDCKLEDQALKFLIFTPESLKLKIINDNKLNNFHVKAGKNIEYMARFIGNSTTIANAYLQNTNTHKLNALFSLRYLYFSSNDEYLDTLEIYFDIKEFHSKNRLGLRISADIMKKHKKRVLSNPAVYLNLLNKNVLANYLDGNDAKIFAKAAFPEEVTQFWDCDYLEKYNFILNLIPAEQKYKFVKDIFSTKYPNEEFEMSVMFYKCKFYTLMTEKEREEWALRHIASGKNLFGDDFKLYKFVNFTVAFDELKKLVRITTEKFLRSKIISTMVSSTKNLRDLQKVLEYYYERHVNEETYYKNKFIRRILSAHNIYIFDADCWGALNKLFYSLDMYNSEKNTLSEFLLESLLYHILHNQNDMPAIFKKKMKSIVCCDLTSFEYEHLNNLKSELEKLDQEQKDLIYQYMFKVFVEDINFIGDKLYNDDLKIELRKYIKCFLDILSLFKKSKDDIPESVNKFIELDFAEYDSHSLFPEIECEINTPQQLLLHLKKDAFLVRSNFDLVKESIKQEFHYNITKVLHKLKIYFSKDLSEDYINLFIQLLTEKESSLPIVKTAVYGIFHLADEKFIHDFMIKYEPSESKIDRAKIDSQVLYIQEAICRLAAYSRPPVPLPVILRYIKGDYVHYCLPLFYKYLANLPQTLYIKFVESIIDTPISIQKHGLRLAFKCFSLENLKEVISHQWKKTKNVSLRIILFKTLLYHFLNGNQNVQMELFEIVKMFIMNLNEDDVEKVFDLIQLNPLPTPFISEFYELSWRAIDKFADKPMYIKLKTVIIDKINRELYNMKENVLDSIVNEHIQEMLFMKKILQQDTENEELITAKWKFVANCLAYTPNEDKFVSNKALVVLITEKCIEMRNDVVDDEFVVRIFFLEFMCRFERRSYSHGFVSICNVGHMLDSILQKIENCSPFEEWYMYIWFFKLSKLSRNAAAEGYKNINKIKALKPDDNVQQVVLDAGKHFGNIYADLLKKYIEQKIYYESIIRLMKNYLESKLCLVLHFLNGLSAWEQRISQEDFELFFAIGLIEKKYAKKSSHPAFFLTALDMLPVDYEGDYPDAYKAVINKIKTSDSREVQCNVFYKFVFCNS